MEESLPHAHTTEHDQWPLITFKRQKIWFTADRPRANMAFAPRFVAICNSRSIDFCGFLFASVFENSSAIDLISIRIKTFLRHFILASRLFACKSSRILQHMNMVKGISRSFLSLSHRFTSSSLIWTKFKKRNRTWQYHLENWSFLLIKLK